MSERTLPAEIKGHRFPAEIKGHRFPELDSIRGLAAISVVLVHICGIIVPTPRVVDWLLLSPLNVGFAGASAVLLFFTLSGFVLTLPYCRGIGPNYTSYISKRFCRLYLPYAVSLLLTVGLRLCVPSPVVIGQKWIDFTWNSPVTLHDVLYGLTGIGNFNPYLYNGVIWTLVIEMRISIVLPLLAWLAIRLPPKSGLVISIVLACLLAWVDPHLKHRFLPYTLLYGFMFFNGALLAANIESVASWWVSLTRSKKITLFVSSWLMYGYYQPLTDVFGTHSFIIGPLLRQGCSLASMVFFLVATQHKNIRHLLHHRTLLHFGGVSYTLYLIHLPLLLFAIHATHGHLSLLVILVVLPICILVLTEGFHYAVEKPTMLLGRYLGAAVSSRQ